MIVSLDSQYELLQVRESRDVCLTAIGIDAVAIAIRAVCFARLYLQVSLLFTGALLGLHWCFADPSCMLLIFPEAPGQHISDSAGPVAPIGTQAGCTCLRQHCW